MEKDMVYSMGKVDRDFFFTASKTLGLKSFDKAA